jgi:hypothetical protein
MSNFNDGFPCFLFFFLSCFYCSAASLQFVSSALVSSIVIVCKEKISTKHSFKGVDFFAKLLF